MLPLLSGGWFDTNTEVFSLQDIAAPAKPVGPTRPGSMAPSPARGNLAIGYLVMISPVWMRPPASHSSEVVAVHQHNETEQIHMGTENRICAARGEQQQTAAWGSCAYVYLYYFFPPNSPITIFKCKYVFF